MHDGQHCGRVVITVAVEGVRADSAGRRRAVEACSSPQAVSPSLGGCHTSRWLLELLCTLEDNTDSDVVIEDAVCLCSCVVVVVVVLVSVVVMVVELSCRR